jgi:hypothetical protein
MSWEQVRRAMLDTFRRRQAAADFPQALRLPHWQNSIAMNCCQQVKPP